MRTTAGSPSASRRRIRAVVFSVSATAALLAPAAPAARAASSAPGAGRGAVDRSYGNNGTALVRSGDGAVAVAHDAAGNAFVLSTGQHGVAVSRYLPDGRLDVRFGTGGFAGVPLGDVDATLTDITLAPDGRIVLSESKAFPNLVRAVRLLPNGRLDGSLKGSGFGPWLPGSGTSVAVDHANRVLLAVNDGGYPGVERLTVRGELDDTFGWGGRINVLPAPHGSVYRITLDANDRVYAVGSEDTGGYLTRLNAAGRRDPGFGNDGVVTVTSVPSLYHVAVAPDGKPLAVGAGYPRVSVFRFLTNGARDAAYGSNGVATAPTPNATVFGFTTDAAGGALLAGIGATLSPAYQMPTLERITPTGQRDASFGCGGTAWLSFGLSERRGDVGTSYVAGLFAHGSTAVVVGTAFGARTDGAIALQRVNLAPAATSTSLGYRLVSADGHVDAFGAMPTCESLLKLPLRGSVVGAANTPSGAGYWAAMADGGVVNRGDAAFYGSAGSLRLHAPVVAVAATTSGHGYWLAAADGGVFTFGDAHFYGSTGAIALRQPIVAMLATRTGRGYWLVARDGGVFSFGDAAFYGSTGALTLRQPVVGAMNTVGDHGYWLVARDGGVFAFGSARFYGSTGALRLAQPIVGGASTTSSHGYWLLGADGGVFTFGDARFAGSDATTPVRAPFVAIAPSR